MQTRVFLGVLIAIMLAVPLRAQTGSHPRPLQTREDPHRWLEDMGSETVLQWAREQDQLARSWIHASGAVEGLLEQIVAAANHEVFTSPIPAGDRYFYSRSNSSGTHREILVRDGLQGTERTVVNHDAAAGRTVAPTFWPSPDGAILAYGISDPGSRWMELRFRDVARGTDLPDVLYGLQAARMSNVTWATDGSGVWYDRFDIPDEAVRTSAPLTGSRVAYHTLGTDADADVIRMRTSEGGTVRHQGTDDGRWLVITETQPGGEGTQLWVARADADSSAPRLLSQATSGQFALVGSKGDELWLYTTHEAPNGEILSVTLRESGTDLWNTIVAERDDPIDSWTGAVAVGDVIAIGYRRRGALELRIARPEQPAVEPAVVPFPTLGSVWFGVTGRQGKPEFFYNLSGFADPGTVYRYDLGTGVTEPYLVPRLPYDPEAIVTKQVFYRGPAGDSIPMFLAYHRDSPPDGTRPIMMYGYAFGNWSASPWFRPHMGAWFGQGGAFALPALRGGGEFGAAWAAAGLRENRQNAIDDFIAAGRWLIAEGYGHPELLVAETNSAGASVVGAAVVQEPELFSAAVLAFPLLDVLRYDRFTGGARWRSQLGDPADPAMADALRRYSPVNSIAAGRCYPPVLVTPGELDETTPPFHAYKYVAALQTNTTCSNPNLLRISWGAGHTYGKDQGTTLRNFADQLAFLIQALPDWKNAGRAQSRSR